MKRLPITSILLGITLAFLLHYFPSPASSLAQDAQPTRGQVPLQGEFDSIVLDFHETPEVLSQLPDVLTALSTNFNLNPTLNSEFSEADNIYVVPGDRALLKDLQTSTLVSKTEFIEPNYIYSKDGFSVNDPDYDKQWNLRQIEAESAWEKRVNGQGVTVAIIDTGISQGPDLAKTEFVAGYDFVNDRTDASDDNGHGTHVAGTIAQSTNNGYGVAGIAHGAKLMPLKVLNRGGSGTISDIAEAIRFAADHGADVINMSLGGGGESALMREAIDYAYGKGVVIVAAAGNESRNSASYPALYPNVIGVSAIGPNGEKAVYSNYGEGVDIAAPGGVTGERELDGILQETINPRTSGEFQFKHFQGTSMASPHVAGVAALIKSQHPNMSPEQVWEVLQASAQSVEGDRQNHFGVGYLNAKQAVQGTSPIRFDFSGLNWKDMAFKLSISALLSWLLIPRGSNFNPWNFTFLLGIVLGSIGLFFFRAIYIANVPHWPLRLVGSAIPELGGAIWNNATLNPIFASVLIPFGLMTLLVSHRSLKWVSLGIAIGMTAFMVVATFGAPSILWIGTGRVAQIYLLANAVICGILTALFFRVALDNQQANP
ncbi:MAG: S8 family serine peptidase [Leptolyngbya sp. SIO1E4]|nr:S8 family serine peptidase [Leptolyngbya sp. SIO1E4]